MKEVSFDKIKSQISDLRNNAKAVIIFIVVVLFLDGVIILRGQFVSVFRMFREASKLKKSIIDTKEDARFFSTYNDRMDVIKAQLKELENMSVVEGGLPKVIESISKFANISGARILKIRPVVRGPAEREVLSGTGSEGEAVEFLRQKFSIDIRSGFHQLGRFVALIENSEVFMDIKTIEIRANDRDRTKQLVTILLEVVLTNQ